MLKKFPIKRPNCCIAGIFISLVAISTFAQENWESIPFEKWTKSEVKKVVSSSPWAQRIEVTLNVSGQVGSRDLSLTAEAMVVLRSALPVRQALLRKLQLDAKYDQMGAAEKETFDQKNLPLIKCSSCSDFYSISIVASRTKEWDYFSEEELKTKIYLCNELGEKRYMQHLVIPNYSELVFIFPRRNAKGEDLITEKNKKIIFNTDTNTTRHYQPIFFSKVEFDVQGIIRDGKVIF